MHGTGRRSTGRYGTTSMPSLTTGSVRSGDDALPSGSDLHKVGGSRMLFSALHERAAISTGASILVGRAKREGRTTAPPGGATSGVPKDLFHTTSPSVPPAVTSRPTLGSTTLRRPASTTVLPTPASLVSPPLGASAPGRSSLGASKAAPLPAPSTFTVQRSENRWQQVGRAEPALERPTARREILQLDAQYTAVMQHAAAHKQRLERGDLPTTASVSGDTTMDSDLFGCRTAAAALVEAGFKANADRRANRDLGDDSSDGGASDAGSGDVMEELTWRLATVLFEQKWTDLVLSDVAQQVGVSCLEHGNLLERLREGVGTVFGHFKQVVSVALRAAATATTRATAADQQRLEERKRNESLEDVYQQQYEKRVAEVEADCDNVKAQAHARVTEAQEQVDRMSETLRTLNAAFRQMRSDDKSMRVADLRLACNQLEAKLTQRTAEVEALLPLRQELQESAAALSAAQDELTGLRSDMSALKEELREKTVMLQESMQREADRLAEAELAAAESSKQAAGEGGAEGGSGGASASAPGSSVLCARCNSNIAEVTAKAEREREQEAAVACRHYRVLLPNMVRKGDHGPYRTAEWVRWVMRAIVLSKLRADALATRAPGGRRPRFPEFVYSWFHPATSVNLQEVVAADPIATAVGGGPGGLAAGGGPSAAGGGGGGGSTAGGGGPGGASGTGAPTATVTAAVSGYADGHARMMQAMHEADEARWALYYGMKQVAKSVQPGSGSFEAKLFFNFLDEKYGEDELTFFLYCLRTIEGVLSTPLEWGPTTATSSVSCVPERLDAVRAPPRDVYGKVIADPEPAPSPVGTGPMVPTILWIGLRKALAAAARVLGRASEQDRQITLRRIKAKAVEIDGRRLVDQIIPPDPLAPKTATASLQGLGGDHKLENHLRRMQFASSSPTRPRVRRPAEEVRCVDLFVVLRLLLVEYREEQAHRRAAVSMMFDAAAESKRAQELKEAEEAVAEAEAEAAAASDSKDADDAGGGGCGGAEAELEAKRSAVVAARRPIPRSRIAVDLRQLMVIVTTLNNATPMQTIAELYRDAYDPDCGGVTLAKFIQEAERRQLYSDCLRLPPFVGSMRATTLSKKDLQQLASVVHRRCTLLFKDLVPWLDVLPDPWAQQLRFYRSAVEQELTQCGHGFNVDGRRPLVAYRQYLSLLLFVRLCRREEVGEAGGPLAVRHIEKELEAMERIIRDDAPALLPGPEELRRVRLMLGHRAAARLLAGQPVRAKDMVGGDADGSDHDDDNPDDDSGSGGGSYGSGGSDTSDDADDDAELEAEGIEDLINMGLAQASAGDPRVLIRTSKHDLRFGIARRQLCAARIQRAFRAHTLPAGGVPFLMRAFMHRWYNPHTGGLRRRRFPSLVDLAPPRTGPDPATAAKANSVASSRGWLQQVAHTAFQSAASGSTTVPEAEVEEEEIAKVVDEAAKSKDTSTRAVSLAAGYSLGRDSAKPVAEALSVVLSSLSQVFLSKLRCDRSDDANGLPHQPMVEFVYDFYMQLFGVREVAERELHQLFASVREYASRHPRVRLFALFCGIPLTQTESTKHGYFDLDTHLATRAATDQTMAAGGVGGSGGSTVGGSVSAGPSVALVPDGDDLRKFATKSVASDTFTAAEASGVRAAVAPTFGVASREREAATERELMAPAAVDFYLKLLVALAEDANRPDDPDGGSSVEAEPHSAPDLGDAVPVVAATTTASGVLFPTLLQPEPSAATAAKKPGRASSDVPKSFVRLNHAQRITSITLSALSDAAPDRISRRLEAFAEGTLVDMDMVLRLCMEEWAAETYKRGQKLAALFHAGDVDTNGVLSLDEFMGVIRHVRPKDSDTDAVRMFREATLLTESRIRRRTGGSNVAGADETEIDVVSFLEVARTFGLSTVKLAGGGHGPSTRDPANMARLLQLTWDVYKDAVIADSDAVVPEPLPDAAVSNPASIELHDAHQKLKERLARFVELQGKLGVVPVAEDAAESAWLAFRLLLSDWGRFRQLASVAVLPGAGAGAGGGGAGVDGGGSVGAAPLP